MTEARSISPMMRERRSPRALVGPVPERAVIAALFEAARWAPSAFNEQPWRFVVATADDPAEFSKLLGCLYDGNQLWCKNAPILMIGVAKNFFDYKHAPNNLCALDLGLAVENLLLEAVGQGLYAHPMSGFSPDAVRKAYGVPAEYEPKVAIAAGYLGDPAILPEELRAGETAERTRKPISEIVFAGGWERPWDAC